MASKDPGGADSEREVAELPPSGTSLHRRRRGEAPESLKVKSRSPSDVEGSPLTSSATPHDLWSAGEPHDPLEFCNSMLERLKCKDDILSRQGIDLAFKTKNTLEALDQLERLLDVLEEVVNLKDRNARILKRLRDVDQMRRLQEARLRIGVENERLKDERKELEMLNEAFEGDLDLEYGLSIYDGLLSGGRLLRRGGSKWKGQRFRGSLLRKQRSRSAGGDEGDTPPAPLRRMSEAFTCRDVDKSKVSKWTKVKAAFRWEKAHWPPAVGGTSGAVAAGALVGAVVLAGTSPPALEAPDTPRDHSLTPGSALSLTPNSSCEELRLDSGSSRRNHRCEDIDNTFLHAPTQEESSSPSPNKLHKSPWDKMRDIIHTRRESVRKKSRARGSPEHPRRSPEGPRRSLEGPRRRSLSDGGDSDAPPALTLTIPSSEELESEPTLPPLRKQRSLELAARLPRPPRASKWSKVKRAFLTSHSASVPSSPSRHSAFFTDADTEGVSSGGEAAVREEIARDYAALQSRLRREFLDRRGKLHSASRPVATEEQLSADFRKKLAEWQRLKGRSQPPPAPARRDLSDDFLKKWDEWKHMKETNSVPAWETEARPDEVLVQTSTGLFKFKGISRSFTRKLHEWEKSRGIAPEASTSALLRAARERSAKPPAAPLTRTQSAGSVAPSASGSGRLRASSLSVNDADHLHMEYGDQRELDESGPEAGRGGRGARGAVLVEVEATEECTAAPLYARSPRPAPQTPVYTYPAAEPRLLCETSAAVTGTALLQPAASGTKSTKGLNGKKTKKSIDQKTIQKSKRKVFRQPSLEEDAKFIRDTIEQIERGSSTRLKENAEMDEEKDDLHDDASNTETKNHDLVSTNNNFLSIDEANLSESSKTHELDDQVRLEDKKRDSDKANGKKKSKSRARLEREHSKPSESDTGEDVDTVTVEIPRRRKRPRRQSEKPRTPPTSLHSDSEGEIFVLKLQAPAARAGSPEVFVRTTRRIFSPVVRSGETVPRAVVSVDVDDLPPQPRGQEPQDQGTPGRSKSSGDLAPGGCEEARTRARPPLPLSPPSQRKPQPKETAPSIRIMIQRYNMKINEEGHTSGASSGASSPAWRSPAAERRRPPDMPVGLNIRNNPFLEKEVQKSASACQLSRRAPTPPAQTPPPALSPPAPDGPLKSRSATAFVRDQPGSETPDLTRNLPVFSSASVPSVAAPRPGPFERSVSTLEPYAAPSERAARLREARARFLATAPMRREGTSSAGDLRPGDRSSRISTCSDAPPAAPRAAPRALLRSASTGMVNVQQSAWDRLTADGKRDGRAKSKFSLSRLAAKLRRRDAGAVSRLCRQSLLVQLRTKP